MLKRKLAAAAGVLAALLGSGASAADLADAVMRGDTETARRLIAERVEPNDPPHADGTPALLWAARRDDVGMARALPEAGAGATAETRIGVTPLRLAAINGSAAMLEVLLAAGADANALLTAQGDTALMLAARTGRIDAIETLLDRGADVNAAEDWGGTTALMWAITEHHPAAARLLLEHGAAVDARSKVAPQRARGARGVEGEAPVVYVAEQLPASYANGGFAPLHFAAREGELEAAQALLAAGADVDAIAADGKNVLGLAIYNGHYELASFLVQAGADVNHAAAAGVPPRFRAVDRPNPEWNPGFPWVQTADPLPLITQLLEAGAEPNVLVDNTPESRRNFGGSPRIKFATSLMRAAYSGDVALVRLLLDHGADPLIMNSDKETALLAASGYGWIDGYSQGRSNEQRLETMRLLVERGADVNWACDHGITPLMVAANFGDTSMIQYLVDEGADLSAHDLGKKNDGVFGGSIEPLMAIDYAVGVGTFRPNNAIIHMAEATALLTRLMQERGVKHTTSECTLRAFSCGDVDPQGSSPAQIAKTRAIQVGNQVEGISGGRAAGDTPPARDN